MSRGRPAGSAGGKCQRMVSTHGRHSVLGAPIFYRLWRQLRRTVRRRVTRELLSVAMVQGRSPEPIWTSALPVVMRCQQ